MASLITLGDLIDRSVAHYEKYWHQLLSLGAILFLASIPSIISKLLPEFLPANTNAFTNVALNVFDYAASALVLVITTFYTIRLIRSIKEQAGGKSVDSSPRAAWKTFIPFAVLNALIFLILLALALPPFLGVLFFALDQFTSGTPVLSMIGMFLLLVGGPASVALLLYVGVILRFAPYALALEKTGVIESFRYAKKIVRGRWLSTFFLYFIPFVTISLIIALITYLTPVILQYVAALFTSILPDPLSWGRTAIGTVGAIGFQLVKVLIFIALISMLSVVEYYLFESLQKSAK